MTINELLRDFDWPDDTLDDEDIELLLGENCD